MHGMCPDHRPPCISTRHATHATHTRPLSAATPAAERVIGECALSDTQVLRCAVPPPLKDLFYRRRQTAAPQICCCLLRKNTMRHSRMQVGTSMMLYCSSAWSSAQSRRPWTHPRRRSHPSAPQEDEAGRVHDVLQLQRLDLCPAPGIHLGQPGRPPRVLLPRRVHQRDVEARAERLGAQLQLPQVRL